VLNLQEKDGEREEKRTTERGRGERGRQIVTHVRV